MKSPNLKKKYLEMLEESPFPTIVARKLGINKSTIYRWKKKDYEFKNKGEDAIQKGRESMTEVVEGVTYTEAKKGNIQACRLILESNDKRYRKPRSVTPYDSPDERVDGIDINIHYTKYNDPDSPDYIPIGSSKLSDSQA